MVRGAALASAFCLSLQAVLATGSLYMTPEQLARRATLIVEGTVVRTASGLDPETGALSTYVTLEDLTVHRGQPEASRASSP